MVSSPQLCRGFRGGGRQAGAAYSLPARKRPPVTPRAWSPAVSCAGVATRSDTSLCIGRGPRTASRGRMAAGQRASPARIVEGDRMRRLFVAATLCAAILLARGRARRRAGTACARRPPRGRAARRAAARHDDRRAQARFAPLAARLAHRAGSRPRHARRTPHGAADVGAGMEWCVPRTAETSGTGARPHRRRRRIRRLSERRRRRRTARSSRTPRPTPTTLGCEAVRHLGRRGSTTSLDYARPRVRRPRQRGGPWARLRLGSPCVSAGTTGTPQRRRRTRTTDGARDGAHRRPRRHYACGSAKFFWDEGVEFYGRIGCLRSTSRRRRSAAS